MCRSGAEPGRRPAGERDLIAPVEIAAAITFVVQNAYGISPDDVPSETCRLSGFGRSGEDMNQAVRQGLAERG